MKRFFANNSAFRFCLALLTLVLILPALSSCDFLRRLAGRPDSVEIERLRIAKRQDEYQKKLFAIEAARADSIKAAKLAAKATAEKDSLAAMESLNLKQVKLVPLSKYGSLKSNSLKYRYYIITGTYQMMPNAERQAATAKAAGYEVEIIRLNNGYSVVGVSPSDKISDIALSRIRVSKENFCPEDSWILVNDRKDEADASL